MAFAKGKYAKAISDRSGMEFPYREMVREHNGMFVHKSEYEAEHPQNQTRAYGVEGHGLRYTRPARAETDTTALLGPNPFQTISAGSGIINVYEKSHGRDTDDTVRFRGPIWTSIPLCSLTISRYGNSIPDLSDIALAYFPFANAIINHSDSKILELYKYL